MALNGYFGVIFGAPENGPLHRCLWLQFLARHFFYMIPSQKVVFCPRFLVLRVLSSYILNFPRKKIRNPVFSIFCLFFFRFFFFQIFKNRKFQKLIPKPKNFKISEIEYLGFQDHFTAYFNPKLDLEKELEPFPFG